MSTKVIHIKDSKKSNDEVYIGRAGKGKSGYWDNPIRIGQSCTICGSIHDTAGATLPCYEIYLDKRLSSDASFKEQFWKLKGKTLVCFCHPNPCHG